MLQKLDARHRVPPSTLQSQITDMTPSSSRSGRAAKCNFLSCHSYCREEEMVEEVVEEEALRFLHKNKINKAEVPGEEVLKVEDEGQS